MFYYLLILNIIFYKKNNNLSNLNFHQYNIIYIYIYI